MATDTTNTTVIELSVFENANSKLPPTVTGTVYQVQAGTDDSGNYESYADVDDGEETSLELLLSVEKYLKTKAAEILRQNPWLASKIIKNPNDNNSIKAKMKNMKIKVKNMNVVGKLAIEFPTQMTEEECTERVRKVVRVVTTVAAGGDAAAKLTDSTTSKEMASSCSPSALDIIIADPITENTYAEIVESVRPMLHASTESVVGSESGSLWDIILIPLTESTTSHWKNKFLLVHSLNHSLADGATLYKIYSMLSADRPVERLYPTREIDFDRIKKEKLGGDPNFLRSTAAMSGIAKRLVRFGFGSNPSINPNIAPNQTSMWTVDEEKIRAIKEEYKTKIGERTTEGSGEDTNNNGNEKEDTDEPSVPFLSTNDILTSWFLRQNIDAATGCMIVDMRGRHPDISPNLAGNYEAEIIYNAPCDVETPAWIRASLTRPDGLLKRVKNRDLPGTKTLSGGLSKGAPGNSIVTNWSSLYETVILKQKGDIELLPETHLPILLQHHGVLNSIGWNMLVVFRLSEDKVGLLVMAPPSATEGQQAPVDRPALIS